MIKIGDTVLTIDKLDTFNGVKATVLEVRQGKWVNKYWVRLEEGEFKGKEYAVNDAVYMTELIKELS